MFGKPTLRAKLLIGIAVACAGYVLLVPDASQTIEPTRGGGAATPGAETRATSSTPHVIKPAAAGRKSPIVNASLRMSDRIVQDTAAASLFSAQSWYVTPPAPPPVPVVYQAPAAPTAPPLPFTFMGSYKAEGGGSTYFLTAGDRVYDVKVGDTLDNTYSVDEIKSGQLLLTYMPLKIQQSLAVGEE
ncbi:MAG: secretion system X translation initiation factor [Pseudomonadota bacterium]|nr:secretion system X translation initiation factor [Pseudomonadota bacterium]